MPLNRASFAPGRVFPHISRFSPDILALFGYSALRPIDSTLQTSRGKRSPPLSCFVHSCDPLVFLWLLFTVWSSTFELKIPSFRRNLSLSSFRIFLSKILLGYSCPKNLFGYSAPFLQKKSFSIFLSDILIKNSFWIFFPEKSSRKEQPKNLFA